MNDRELDAIADRIGKAMGQIITGAFIFGLAALGIMVFWNAAAPDVFDVSELTMRQSLCFSAILLLTGKLLCLRK